MKRYLIALLLAAIVIAPIKAADVTNPQTNASALTSGTLPVANGGVDQTAWSTYTPTASCGTGTITTDTVAGRFKLLSLKTMIVQITLAISTLGTCTGNVTFSVPAGGNVNATGQDYVGNAININTGAAAPVFAVGSSIIMFFSAAPLANTYYLTIVYETT